MTRIPLWRDAVVYEVCVRSFTDSDGDGEGDLQGIRSRLGYLRDRGVDGFRIDVAAGPLRPPELFLQLRPTAAGCG